MRHRYARTFDLETYADLLVEWHEEQDAERVEKEHRRRWAEEREIDVCEQENHDGE